MLHNGFIHTKDTLKLDLKDIFTGIKNGISNGIDTIKTKKRELADNIKTDISDFLGFNSESVGKWRKDLADTANRVNINRASKYSKKRFATQSTAHEKIKEYNSYLEKLKSGDDIISQQANNNINTLIGNLKSTNSELAEFIEQRRKAAEEATAEGESTVYEELSSEDYMESQRESIRNLLDNDGIRATIDQYRALGNATGQVSEQQRVMIAGIRERDEAFANFLEQNPAATMGQYPEYYEFIQKVLARDFYTCQCCGKKNGVVLEVHHLDGYDWCVEKRTDETNGVTLCEDCHKSFHSIYKCGNNTKEQFEEWLGKTMKLLEFDGTLALKRQVICHETQKIYSYAVECAEDIGCRRSEVYDCCNHKNHSLYKKHYFWLDEYQSLSPSEIDEYVNYKNTTNAKQIICITTGKIFKSTTYASQCYNIKTTYCNSR